ncbi:Rds1 protein [Fomitopsis serialis]|uniref:Rds1 protein n=1 Tax=Fomitopsis serialis TaxID=139415 RepID=UPI00200724D0|nr:Rds1 protein [Neoantrodia serialis]KAH9935647.1 Rds1 protein [Neoantrodia serialis]
MRSFAISIAAAALTDLAHAAPAASSFGTNGSLPNLGLYQELIELDLFHNGLAKFSAEDFQNEGLNADDMYLLQFMADQEVGHATAIAICSDYSYPFETVREFLQFSEFVTRFGEAGTYGFLEHLNSRDAAQIVLQAVTTEARQEMIFRQFEGIFPMPFWFNPAITQSMQWTLMAPYIVGCPDDNARVEFQNFPALNITNNPNVTQLTSNSTPALHDPGETIYLEWESPGKSVGPNNSYVTNTTAGDPKFIAWISQLNVTYTPLTNISGNSGHTTQPNLTIYSQSKYTDGSTAPLINGTVFVLVTDDDTIHVVAGPAAYFSG